MTRNFFCDSILRTEEFMINNYNYDLVKKEFPTLYESVEFNIANLLRKYNTKMYKCFTKYLATDKTNTDYKDKIDKYLYSLYLDSLTKDDLKELKFLNKNIDYLIKKLDFEYLVTFSETGAVDIPPMQKDDSIINNANKIILRDNNGFYSTDENFQNKIVNEQAVFTTLHNYITNKEKIMSGKRTINSRILNRKEVLLVANYLRYGSIREEILESQTRKKEKVLTKTKEL